MFAFCRNLFVIEWERFYSEKCPFEPKDGIALAAMLKAHPQWGEAAHWSAMVTRYLADEFWGRKRHPLVGLATKAREFAGPTKVMARPVFAVPPWKQAERDDEQRKRDERNREAAARERIQRELAAAGRSTG